MQNMIVPPKLAGKLIKDHKLIYIDLIIRDEKDWAILQSFLADEPDVKKCKLCGSTIDTLSRENCYLHIMNPLGDTMGFKLANPIIHCPKCNTSYELFSSLDYTALKSVTAFIKALKEGVTNKNHG